MQIRIRGGHRFDVFTPYFQRAGTIIIGVHQQNGVDADIGGVGRGLQGFPGVVAARAGNTKALALGFAGHPLHDLIVFFPGQGGAFTGRTDGQHTGNAAGDLEVHQAIEAVVIDGLAGKGRDNGGVASCLHDGLLFGMVKQQVDN